MAGKDPTGSASDFYSKGNEAFVNEDYKSALELYTSAISHGKSYKEAFENNKYS